MIYIRPKTQRLIDRALSEHRCVFGFDHAQEEALRNLYRRGMLVRMHCGLYLPRTYHDRINAHERSRHKARALHVKHPQWVMTGVTALDFHWISHSYDLHDSYAVWIVDQSHNSGKHGSSVSPLVRVAVHDTTIVTVEGIPMTDIVSSVVIAMRGQSFPETLTTVDSALRSGVTKEELLECAKHLRSVTHVLRCAVRYATGLAESGGESMALAAILMLGFAIPEQQVAFRDPLRPNRWFRVDFLWRLPDGRVIVLEFDGMQKYMDPAMTNRKNVKELVADQMGRDRILRACGVATIVHCTFDDVMQPSRLLAKLRAAEVPWTGVPAELRAVA